MRPTRVSSRLRPEATAPDETRMNSVPARCRRANWSTSAEMRVVSGRPSSRVSTLLPILTTMRRYFFDSQFIIHNSKSLRPDKRIQSPAPPLPSLRGAWRRGNPIKGRNLTTRPADSHVGPSALPGMTIQFSPFVSGFIFISHALDRDDAFVADLLAQLADVHVDRAVAHDDLRAPDLGVDLLAGNQLPGRRVEQVQ